MLTPKDISSLANGLSLHKLKTLGLASLASVLMMTTQDVKAQVSAKDVKKSHERMIESQKNLFASWAHYIEWKEVRAFMAAEIAKYHHNDDIFDSKVLKSSASDPAKDPVLMKKQIVDKALVEAMKLFKADLEAWVIWFDSHIKSSDNIYAVKKWKADWGHGYGHYSHGYDAGISFDKKVYGKSGSDQAAKKYNSFLNNTFKSFKSGAEALRASEWSNDYQIWLSKQTAQTYKEVEDQTKAWLESIYDILSKQAFSTKNHTTPQKGLFR